MIDLPPAVDARAAPTHRVDVSSLPVELPYGAQYAVLPRSTGASSVLALTKAPSAGLGTSRRRRLAPAAAEDAGTWPTPIARSYESYEWELAPRT